MSSLGSPNPFFIAGKKAYEVERSLRFNRSDSAHLTYTPASASSDRTKVTISAWVKKCGINEGEYMIAHAGTTNNNRAQLRFYTSSGFDNISFAARVSGSWILQLFTTAKFRDPSAWYHIVARCDTTNGTANIYINGVEETSFTTSTKPSGSQSLEFFNNSEHQIGQRGYDNTGYMNGYIAEINVIQGQALDASYFGETDAITGQWNPKKYTGGYGDGFYLNFSDNSGTTATTLGKDSSGNGNNFTPNNFSVSAGEGNDSLEDSPTNNFCTINPLDTYRTGNTLAEGNLKLTRSSGNLGNARGTFALNSGKWYYEWKCTGQHTQVGWVNTGFNINYNSGDVAVTSSGGNGVGMYWDSRAFMYGWENSGGNTYFPSSGSAVTYTTGDIIMVAFDIDNFKFWFGKNGSWINVLGTADPSSGTDGITPVASKNDGTYVSGMFFSPLLSCFSGGNGHVNFGQRPFSYTIPTGYQTLCSANLPDPTILLPNQHFEVRTYTGTGAGNTQTLTGFEFAPDWVWGKSRTSAYNHGMFDTVRGATNRLWPNLTNAEASNNAITAFTSDGYSVSTDAFNQNSQVTWNWNAGDTDGKTYTVTVVSDSGNKYRFDGFGTSAVTLDLAEGGTYIFNYPSAHPFRFSTTSDGTHGGGSEYTTGVTVLSSTSVQIVVAASAPQLHYFCTIHSGMGGAINTNSTLGSSNFDGSIQTTVKVNATAGFSIVSYDSSNTNGSSFGHGLGVAPDHIIFKNRDQSQDWLNYHAELGTSKYLYLDLTNAAGTSSNWIGTSSSVFIHNNTFASANNGSNYIAYCFSEVAGYSKFGSYTGNGSSDGTFVFTGFKVQFLLIKKTNTSESWILADTKRNSNVGRESPADSYLLADSNNAESTGIIYDMLSNGFKFRSTSQNTSGHTYIYLAFAESPFKNARAR